jgi:hypothetical protein
MDRTDRLQVDAATRAANRLLETADKRRIRIEQMKQRVNAAKQRERQGANRLALIYNAADDVKWSHIGNMDKVCGFCAAKTFVGETAGVCCCSGKVRLDGFPPLPELLQRLYHSDDADSRHFRLHLRQYNNAFAMTSFGHTENSVSGWNPTFRIQGQVFHLFGSLLPALQTEPKFLQVYFMDSMEDSLCARLRNSGNRLNNAILTSLTTWLHEHNQFVSQIKTAMETVAELGNNDERKIVIREDKRPQAEHARRYNAQSTAEIAILMSNEPVENRDIVLHLRNDPTPLRRINELHSAYDPLQYPLLFPYGTETYHVYMKNNVAATVNARKVTMLQYYSYHLMVRDGNYLLRACRLFQQFLVDVYCKIETERLQFLRREQVTIKYYLIFDYAN